MRLLRLFGHGPVGSATPQLPNEALVAADRGRHTRQIKRWRCSGRVKETGAYGRAILPSENVEADTGRPAENASNAARPWRILEGTDLARPPAEPLYGAGRRVALYGLRSLQDAPCARFGKLVTADRDEIEALRNLKGLINDYRDQKEEVKPLSLAVFGPPGAGKSFGIKQIAKQVLPDKTPVLEFNLSQFSDERDLIGAFHQVRDKALEGFIPVVFWDEFDSQKYRWLQFLLAPMQDGRFQEGQITHPIGKSIFVFAGATSFDMENFGPPPSDAEAFADFRLKKGPDFASRLHGYLNVLGPNRRQYSAGAAGHQRNWQEDATDVCFPVRRAMLLRSMLGLVGPRENERLEIDPGLLAALLEVDKYTHGARSMEKIVLSLRRGTEPVIRRSALPSDEIMGMNVNQSQFRAILNRARRFQEYAPKLAKSIHDDWRRRKKQKVAGTFPNDKEFHELPQEMKAANIAAAMRMPRILELAGLYLVPTVAWEPPTARPAPHRSNR